MFVGVRNRLLPLLAVTLVALTGTAHAATLVVDSAGDTPDALPGNGACGATGVPASCTLRAAIQEANANADAANTIDLTGLSGTISVATALPNVTKAVAINGPSARITVDGSGIASLLRFVCTTAPCPSGGNYSISNLVVTNGRTTDAAGGGGIYFGAVGTVNFTLSNVHLTNNEATAGPGGGIAAVLVSNNSTLTLSNVHIGTSGNGNTSSGDGGGLWVRADGATATLELKDSSVVDNTTSAGNGGGIAVARGRLNIYESTLSGNTADLKGGGLYLGKTGSAGGSARIENVTIVGNWAASGGGGGIGAPSDNPAASSMTFTTITNNVGGGIVLAADPNVTFPGNSSSFPFTSNIIASNGDAECAAAFSHSDPDNSGYNLTNDGSCGFSSANHDQVASTSAQVGLASLASNPGLPQTRALLAGSLAIDAGNPNWDTGGDARGATTQDGGADGTPGDGTPVRDIGAYEFGGFGLVQLSLPSYQVGEHDGAALVVIKRYGTGTAITTTPTVVVSSADDTATQAACNSGGDYNALASNPMNFVFTASGATQFEHTASFAICNDTVNGEGSESFDVALAEPGSDGAGYDLGPISSGTVTILDVENGAFRFNPLAYTQNEGGAGSGGSVTLTVTRVSGSMGAVRVSYATTGTCSPACTATADADYTSASGHVDFANGETSKTITVDLIGDTAYEGSETFAVTLTAVSCQGLAPGQNCDARFVGTPERTATVTIGNDDSPVTGRFRFELASYSADEEGGTLTVKVKRVGGSDGEVSVDVEATDGTAEQGTDFNVTSPLGGGTLNWGVGETADKTVTITLVNDVLTESHEGFTLVLSNPQTSTGGLPAPTLGEIPVAAVTLMSGEQPEFQFGAAGYNVSEGGTVTLTVTWTAFTGGDVTVPYFTQDGTAVSPVDYTGVPQATPGTITAVAGGSTSATFQVAVATDALAEGNEAFAATLGAPTGGGDLGANNPATVTIVDPAGARFTAASFTRANEQSGGTITATVERFGDLSEAFSVDFEIGECAGAGCATQGDDYYRLAGMSGTLHWNAGDGAAQPITFNVQSDTLIEGDETVQIALSNAQVGTAPVTDPGALGLAQAAAVIPDDDYRFEIAHASPFAVGEGAGNAVISVSRVGSTLGAASVSFATADGTAIAGNDYTATASPPALSWNAGEGGSKTVTVPLTGDALDEFDETFTLALSNPSANATGEATAIAASPLTVSITDDDVPAGVSLSLSGSPLAENGGVATVTATLSAVSAKDVTVNLAFGGGAAAGADYTAAAASIGIPAGSLQGSTTLTGIDDALDEDDETVAVDIASVVNGAESGTQQVVAAIADDDATPTVTLALAGGTLPENGGVATVTATLSAVSGRSVSVNLAFTGTATSGTDYAASAASIVIAPGQQSGSTTLTTVNDALDEANETAVVDIASVVSGAESGTQQVTATIVDDDATPAVTLALAGSPLPETGGLASVAATLSAVSGRDVTVNLAFAGTATSGPDYAMSSVSIVIAAGQQSGSITLTAASDAVDEANETAVVDIASVVNGVESGTQQVTATIVDDDAGPGVTLSSSASSMAETGGTATLTATLSAVSGQDVTVTLGLAGTASIPADYTATDAAITIPAGATTGSITLASVGDGTDEPEETVIVDITAVTNGTESGTQTQTVTITDDDSSGGGGGALDLLTLGFLLSGLARRRRSATRR